MKGVKGERQEIRSIQAEIIKRLLYYCIVEVRKKILSKLFSINDKIKVAYDCIIKVTYILFKNFVKKNIFNNIFSNIF